MQDLGKIELRFICYQNWDNSEKMMLASNLNTGRVDGIDAVVESVSFELIPLSASIYKQSQEYSGTSEQQTQQPNQKSKTVKLKINVNDKSFINAPVGLGFSLLDDQNNINIKFYSTVINLNQDNSHYSKNIGTTTESGIFVKEVPVTFEYTSSSSIIINLLINQEPRDYLTIYLK
ncbi:hypothetical protein JGI20_00941 [Candidatus Kryptobacter tengchongensis]|nr:hypothetical protein JGI20_00941 [Candidatus Kryptobacter tengchongensis]